MEISPIVVKNCNQINQLPEEIMVSASDSKDCIFHSGAIEAPVDMEISRSGGCDHVTASEGSNEDEEVNIVEDFDPIEERRVVERDLQDATDSSSSSASSSSSSSSSSFGCTDFETENSAMLGDGEVESLIREDIISLPGFDGFNGLFRTRKKKVSDHWRDFVRPLMWRCRWAELCVRELNSKASKYEKEIAENSKRKQNEREKNATEDLCTRSTPFICQNRQQVTKRKKRKRVEETVDLASYTSRHNLFSYYANRKPIPGTSYMGYDRRNADPVETDSFVDAFGVNDEFPAFDFNKNDAFEMILRKIEEAQSQVRELSVRMDKVVTENAEKFTSEIASLAICDPLGSSPNVDGDSLPIMAESIGHLVKCENMENSGFQTRNQDVKQEWNEEVGVGKPLLGKAIQQDPNSPREQHSLKGRSILKPTTTPRKRKRGRRKPRIGRWARRSSASG